MKFFIIALACVIAISGASFDADAATTKKKKSRSSYTKAQQKEFYEYTLKACRKKYGTTLHYVKVDYSSSPPKFWCYHY